jgi:hypothetical protein
MKKRLQARLRGKSRRSVFAIVGTGVIVLTGLVVLVSALTFRIMAETPAQTLYISPSANTVLANEQFTVMLKLDTTVPSDGVEATISFNPSLVQYVSVDASASGFPIELPTQTGNGSVTVSRGVFAPNIVATNVEVAKVTFRALAPTSLSPLGVTGNTTYQGVYLNPTIQSGSVTITSPAPPTDTQAPKVTIQKPAANAQVRNTVAIAASATDNVAAVKTEIYADNTLVHWAPANTAAYTWNIKAKSIAKGEHTITVKSYDAAGNVGTASVKVFKR